MNKFIASLLFLLATSSSWAGTITIGQTSVLTAGDGGNANLLLAQSATLSQTATIQSMSFYVTAAAGKLVLGIYDSVSGGPGHLLASTGAFTPVVGWNTQPVTSPVALAPGTYWLAYLPSDNGLSFVVANTGQWYEDPMTFSVSMPGTFVSTHGDVGNWSLYATFSPRGNPLPSPTPTPTPTAPPGTGKPRLKLFGGVQDFNLSPPLQINYTAPDPLWKPISQGPAIGNQFPSNWWRDGQTIGILWAGNASLATLAARCQTAANWCAANGANGPCLQLTYPGHMPGSWASDSIPNFTNYLDALAPYISAGTYEIAINEILANNGAIQNDDPLLIALGGTGATGWDALIALVKLERQHMPHAWNARRVLTLWGREEPPRCATDAWKEWSGMLSGFYVKRWELFFQRQLEALQANRSFDQHACNVELLRLEDQWAGQTQRYSSKPVGDSVQVAGRLFDKYMRART